MAAKKKRSIVEWAGGVGAMPAYVTGEGEPYRPEALLWMGAEGAVLGHVVAKPGELVALACESLRDAMERPSFGRPHMPDRVRVASPALADALRAGHPEIEVICAPTPEIDALFASMRQHMHEHPESEPSYLVPGVAPDALAALFRAAAALFRAQPWKTVPTDQSVLSLSIDALGVNEVALSVIGQMGESHGVVLYSGIDDFEAFIAAAQAMAHGERARMPPHFALHFERGADLSATQRKEVARHGWEVANASAYPWLVAVDDDLVGRPPTPEEVRIAEAVALALPALLAEKEAVVAAWSGGAPVERTVRVATHAGELEVRFRVPYEPLRGAPPVRRRARKPATRSRRKR